MTFDISIPFVNKPLDFPFPKGAGRRLFGIGGETIAPNVFLTTIPYIFNVARDATEWSQAGKGWYQTLIGMSSGVKIAFVQATVSASNILDCLSFLHICGAQNVVFIGLCGGLLDDVRHGDILVPNAIIRQDRVSEIVTPPGELAKPDDILSQQICKLLRECSGVALIDQVSVISLAAVCQETPEILQEFHRLGAGGVDLESAALLTASRIWGIRAATILIVSDRPLEKDYLIAEGKPSQQCLHSAQKLTLYLLGNCKSIFDLI